MYIILTIQDHWIKAMLEVIAPVLKLPIQCGSPQFDQVCKPSLTHVFQLTNPESDLVSFVRSINTGDNLAEATCLFFKSMLKPQLT